MRERGQTHCTSILICLFQDHHYSASIGIEAQENDAVGRDAFFLLEGSRVLVSVRHQYVLGIGSNSLTIS